MTETKTAPDPDVIFDAMTSNGILINDACVPSARAMREALALLPAGGRMNYAICINPFDPSFHAMLDEIGPASCGDRRGDLSVA